MMKGNLLQVLVKPWAEITGPELQVLILINTGTLLLSVPCAARGDLRRSECWGKASSSLRFSAATVWMSVTWAPLPTLRGLFTLTA